MHIDHDSGKQQYTIGLRFCIRVQLLRIIYIEKQRKKIVSISVLVPHETSRQFNTSRRRRSRINGKREFVVYTIYICVISSHQKQQQQQHSIRVCVCAVPCDTSDRVVVNTN